jgi:hypothetical protein
LALYFGLVGNNCYCDAAYQSLRRHGSSETRALWVFNFIGSPRGVGQATGSDRRMGGQGATSLAGHAARSCEAREASASLTEPYTVVELSIPSHETLSGMREVLQLEGRDFGWGVL